MTAKLRTDTAVRLRRPRSLTLSPIQAEVAHFGNLLRSAILAKTGKPLTGQADLKDRREAPVIFFDGTGPCGHFNGIIGVSLTVAIWKPGEGTKVDAETAFIAHLRTNIVGAQLLRSALDDALLLALPAEGDAKN